MPYERANELPEAPTHHYNARPKASFLRAFNNAYEKCGKDERRPFAVAHAAAKRAGEKPGPG